MTWPEAQSEKELQKIAKSTAPSVRESMSSVPRLQPASAGPKRPSSAPRRRPTPSSTPSTRRSVDDVSLVRRRQLEMMIEKENARESERAALLANVGDARERARLTKLFELERSRARHAMEAFA